MPIKKGKSKAKKKAKGKGKKGKKKTGAKDGEKADKESMMKEAIRTAKLWEARYAAVEKSRLEYRDNARRLVTENESLQGAVNQTERDTIEVIAFLKKEDSRKDNELADYHQKVKALHHEKRAEKEQMAEQFTQKISSLETQLVEKNEETCTMQNELKTVREFRKKRAEMQVQLEQLHESLEVQEKSHQSVLSDMEQKFFEEKARLQKEANRRIAELAGKAHGEAVANLDERTREVYRENIRMSEALTLHMEHEELLQKNKEQLEMSNRQLVAEKELNVRLVKEKISEARTHRRSIKKLQERVQELEESLTGVIREFEEEKRRMDERHRDSLQATSAELIGLQHRNELQTREMNHVKRLARRILEQRSEMEQFFLEALAYVKKEIAANRAQYRRDAQMLYQQRMLDATGGRGEFPSVRTFNPTDTSTNSVYHDMDQAKRWDGLGDKVDVSDLSWEQKEQVLRMLFAKMNQTPKPKRLSQTLQPLPPVPPPSLLPLPPVSSEEGAEGITGDGEEAFLTQQETSGLQTNSMASSALALAAQVT